MKIKEKQPEKENIRMKTFKYNSPKTRLTLNLMFTNLKKKKQTNDIVKQIID